MSKEQADALVCCMLDEASHSKYLRRYHVESSDDGGIVSLAIPGTVALPLVITKQYLSTTRRHGVADGQNRAGFRI